MIPKIIHYCWFGKNRLPKEVIDCINSWKKYLPDYKIVEWNENNFDINKIKWTKEAYENKKYAFVSDYVRLEVLYTYGGIYFDTDIEVVKNIDKFLSCETLLGFEGDDNSIATGIIGANKKSEWIKDVMKVYENKNFVKDNGTLDCAINVELITNIIKNKYNFKQNNTYQELNKGVVIYPKEFFSPKRFCSGKIYLTNNTHIIHHFNASWHDEKQKLFWKRKRTLTKLMGDKLADKILEYYNYCEEHTFNEIVSKLLSKMLGD